MNTKINSAIKKITEEAAELGNGEPCYVMSEYIMDQITNDDVADIVLDDRKTLQQINEKMWDEGRKRRAGNGAYISDAELRRMVNEYYGIGASNSHNVNIDVTDMLL